MSTEIPERLGAYEILEPLGRGAMGEVYRARDPRLGRVVALKLLPPEMARDPERQRRFREEARAVAALNHPNIVTLFSVEEADGLHFMTLEEVRGQSLRQLIADGPVPCERLLQTALQISEGLTSAHRGGILHRDLKPDNVMLTVEGRVKILDFGLAKLLSARPPAADGGSEAQTLDWQGTLPGATLGTAAYMSPEQALGREIDGRSDLFALGVILYEMATGHHPFTASTLAATFDRVLHHAPEPPSRHRSELPPGFDDVVARLLAKEREERYTSAGEVRDDLIRLVQGGLEATRLDATAPREAPSIVVLPFTDLSPDRDQEYLCHGLAEELSSVLAARGGIRVVARTSAVAAREQGMELRDIGDRLGVGTVLEGSVRKAGHRLRITVQLVRAGDSSQLWSQRFDRDMDDVFALQDEIATTVAETLEQHLVDSPTPSARRHPPRDAATYDLYLRGLFAMNRWTVDWIEQAITLFEEVIEKDAANAAAHASLAECLGWLCFSIGIRPARETVPRARSHALRALELDPGHANAHMCLGLIAMNHDWDRLGARRGFERALELDPNSSQVHLWNAWRLLLLEHDYDEARRELLRAEELDPLHLQIKTLIGYVHLFLHDHDRALQRFHRVLELDPGFAFAHYALGDASNYRGRFRQATEHYEEAIRLAGRSVNYLGELAYCHGRCGDEKNARALLAEIEETSERHGYSSSLWRALAHLGLDEVDRLFECLEQAFAERDGSLVLIVIAPELDPLRDDPRFRSLLAKMGLSRRDD